MNLKEIILPVSGHKVSVTTSLRYGDHLELQKALYEKMDIENEIKDKELTGTTQKMNASVFITLLKRKAAIYTKKVILACDINGFGKAGEEVTVKYPMPAFDTFLLDLDKEDGEFLSSEINALEETQKKTS